MFSSCGVISDQSDLDRLVIQINAIVIGTVKTLPYALAIFMRLSISLVLMLRTSFGRLVPPNRDIILPKPNPFKAAKDTATCAFPSMIPSMAQIRNVENCVFATQFAGVDDADMRSVSAFCVVKNKLERLRPRREFGERMITPVEMSSDLSLEV